VSRVQRQHVTVTLRCNLFYHLTVNAYNWHVESSQGKGASGGKAFISFTASEQLNPLSSQRILIPAGKAAPTPPVGPALGARGVKSMDFCKEFNARTAHVEPGTPTPTLITIQPDRTFTFITKTPPTSYFLKKAAGIEKGTGKPSHETVGTISLKHVFEIAKIKATDEHLKHLRLEAIASTIVGSARTLGVQVVP
jgi:large subunit ribosomal protein L11